MDRWVRHQQCRNCGQPVQMVGLSDVLKSVIDRAPLSRQCWIRLHNLIRTPGTPVSLKSPVHSQGLFDRIFRNLMSEISLPGTYRLSADTTQDVPVGRGIGGDWNAVRSKSQYSKYLWLSSNLSSRPVPNISKRVRGPTTRTKMLTSQVLVMPRLFLTPRPGCLLSNSLLIFRWVHQLCFTQHSRATTIKETTWGDCD